MRHATGMIAALSLAACGGGDAEEAEVGAQPGVPLTTEQRGAYDGAAERARQETEEAGELDRIGSAPPFPGLGAREPSPDALPLAGKPDASCDSVQRADGPSSVAGLRVGLPVDEAIRILACDEDITRLVESDTYSYGDLDTRGFAVRTEVAAADGAPCTEAELPHVTDVSRNRSAGNDPLPCEPDRVFGDRAKDVTEEVRLRLMGTPGEEVVYGVFRGTTYEGQARPALAAVRDRLIARHGVPTHEGRSGDTLRLEWSRTPDGALLSPEARDFDCRVSPEIGGREEFGPDCGVQVAAALIQSDDAPLLEELRIAVLDEAGLYRALGETNDALARRRAAGDAEAVRDAADADDLDL